MMTVMTLTADIFLRLIRAAVGAGPVPAVPGDFADWNALVQMTFRQSLPAVALDGLHVIRNAYPDLNLSLYDTGHKTDRFTWYGAVLATEEKYTAQKGVLTDLASFYDRHGIRMMILKGYAISQCYPVPSHHHTGDIDIYLFGDWKKADEAVRKCGIVIDNSHHHHSVFHYKGQMVENHYDFVIVHSHLSGRKIEKRLKELARIPGEEILPDVYLPSPNLNALFVARHTACHFAAGDFSFRQILDWVLLINKIHGQMDWNVFWNDVREMGMMQFVLCMVQIAVERLGMDKGSFHLPAEAEFDSASTDRVLEDTLCRAFSENPPAGLMAYQSWMIRRWWANRWKHRLVYSDSLLSTFFVQIWSHILKPASLRK